jgi:hypothetical protein
VQQAGQLDILDIETAAGNESCILSPARGLSNHFVFSPILARAWTFPRRSSFELHRYDEIPPASAPRQLECLDRRVAQKVLAQIANLGHIW